MNRYKVIRYRKINSQNQIERAEKIITANSDTGAKQIASKLFPTKGRWSRLFSGGYTKGTTLAIDDERIDVIPIQGEPQ